MSMRDRIQTALQPLDPQHVEVLDESHMHSRGLETHFKVVLVSPQFAGSVSYTHLTLPTKRIV